MRGFFSGLFAGFVVVAAGVVALSFLSSATPTPEVASEVSDLEGTNTDQDSMSLTKATRRDPDVVETGPTVSPGPDLGSDSLADVSLPQKLPSKQPEIGANPDAPNLPPKSETAPSVEAADIVVERNTRIVDENTLEAPVKEAIVVSETGVSVAPEVSEEIGSTALPDVDVAPIISAQPERPPSGDVPELQSVSSDPAPDQTVSQSTPSKVSDENRNGEPPEKERQTDVQPDSVTEIPNGVTLDPNVPADSTPASRVAALPQAGTDSDRTTPGFGRPVLPLTERGNLIGEEGPPDEQADLKPIQRFATPFENPDNKPLMSVVLIDDAEALGVEALTEFPYPLAFAIDPAAPDAARRMKRHRDAGFEVLALVDLPTAATAQDAEVLLAAGLDTLNESVGVLEGTGSGIQGNRAVSGQVAAVVKATGLGLITQDAGLNSAHKLAVRDGVPAAVVFRDFDGAGQAPADIRRSLDQAAFRAGQEGTVVMMGRVTPDTISSLLLWGLQDRANRVALAPVSAVMQRSISPQ